jgi:predicted TIM-barrel fold metal-dependent hydrolase
MAALSISSTQGLVFRGRSATIGAYRSTSTPGFERTGPKDLVEQIGEDNLLFETDFPHPTCFYIPTPDVQNHRVDVTSARSESTRRKILQDNAAALYNIDLPSSQ